MKTGLPVALEHPGDLLLTNIFELYVSGLRKFEILVPCTQSLASHTYIIRHEHKSCPLWYLSGIIIGSCLKNFCLFVSVNVHITCTQ